MRKLIPIGIFAMVMAILSHINSGYDPINGRYRKKERLCYIIMSVGLILFAGLRTGYNDTWAYVYSYGQLGESKMGFLDINWILIGQNPGFVFVQLMLIKLGVSGQSFLMIFSIFIIGVNLWFFRKYSCNIWLSVLLFFVFAGYIFTMAAVKQCTAMAFCLIATDRAIHKKYIRCVFYVILGSLFHPYALMYLVVPVLFFRPWSQYTLVMLLAFGLMGLCLESLLGTVLNITDMMGEHYNADIFSGDGVNPIRLLVAAAPMLLSTTMIREIGENEERDQYVIVNLTMLNAELMFVALFGTANYFARLANYFLPFQAVSIPWLLKHYHYKDKNIMTGLVVLCHLLFFVYSQVISDHFDSHFYSISFWDYLKTLF